MTGIAPREALQRGSEILGVKLYPLGFAFTIIEEGQGSGGSFAVGAFRCRDREITLGFRYELGRVSFRKGEVECRIEEYAEQLGLLGTLIYPWFSRDGDPLAGFQSFLRVLEYCGSFLEKEGEVFHKDMKNFTPAPKQTGFKALF
ncbi:MAG TPA: hypothetical protein VNV60_08920 [Holophagaceae bacterium]|jgi:hypothetical protein|nr:hypothetical protein [Holophagaceae bacterium]